MEIIKRNNNFNIIRIDIGGGTDEKGFAFLLAESADNKI